MILLNDLLPKSEHGNFWTILGSDYEGLLDGQQYACLEYYCDTAKYDCKTIFIDVLNVEEDKKGIHRPLASIEYDWSSPETRCRPTLTEKSPKTQEASILLEAYTNFIHDPEYLNRIKTSYNRVNILAAAKRRKGIIYRGNKVGRNDPCTCASGKKFKKCCMYRKVAAKDTVS